MPDLRRLVIVCVDGDVETLLIQFQFLGQQLPGKGDRFLLEVITEGKVAEHFKEGVMAGSPTHIFQVVMLPAGTDTLLRTAGPQVIPLFQTEEDVLELVHTGVGK